MKFKLHNEAKVLILLSAIHSVVGTFFGTFLVAYIMEIASNQAISISIYNIAYYAAVALGFLMLADRVKRKDKMSVYRGSIIIQAICLIGIAVVQDGIAPYVAIVGAVYGLAMAFRHCPYNVLIGEKVNKRMMTPFVGYKSVIGGTASVLTPVFLGLFITAGSYEQTAVAMCFFLALEYVLSYFIRSRGVCAVPFSLKCFLPQITRSILIRRIFLLEFLKGFTTSGPLTTIITMFTIYMFETNLNLGILTSVFAVVGIAVSFLLGRFGQPKFFKKMLVFSNVFMIGASVLFLVATGKLSFIFFRFAEVSALKLINSVDEINLTNASNSACVGADNRTEYFVARDVVLNLGRIFSFIILFTIGASGNMDLLKYYLLLLVLCIAASCYTSIKICRR